MQANSFILVLDIGTTGGRAIVFNSNGHILLYAYQEYKGSFVSQRGIDYEPQTWLNAIRDCVTDITKRDSELISKISAVSVTSQRATLLPVDNYGRPLAPAILWQDKRTIDECCQIEKSIGTHDVYKRTGLKIDPYFSLPKLLWFRNKKPNIFKKTAYFLTTHDYIVYTLTGEFKTDWTQASRTMLFNINEFKWDSFIAGKLNIDIKKLPEAFPTGTIAGKVTKKSAEYFGIPEGLDVIMAGGDQQCAAVGLGVTSIGSVSVITGTGSFVVAPIDYSVRDPEQKVLCSASAIPGSWVLEAGIYTTGATYRWLRDMLLSNIKNSDIDPYDILNREAERSPPGSNGVLHIPHQAGSAAPYWDTKATGILFNLSLSTTKSDVIRAFLEGISFEINKNLKIINRILQNHDNSKLNEVRVSGGLTKSELFNQIQADIYSLNVTPSYTEQATALGAAIIGFVSMGVHQSLNEAHYLMGMRNQKRMKTPSQEVKDMYWNLNILHDRIYKSLAKSDIYERVHHFKFNL